MMLLRAAKNFQQRLAIANDFTNASTFRFPRVDDMSNAANDRTRRGKRLYVVTSRPHCVIGAAMALQVQPKESRLAFASRYGERTSGKRNSAERLRKIGGKTGRETASLQIKAKEKNQTTRIHESSGPAWIKSSRVMLVVLVVVFVPLCACRCRGDRRRATRPPGPDRDPSDGHARIGHGDRSSNPRNSAAFIVWNTQTAPHKAWRRPLAAVPT